MTTGSRMFAARLLSRISLTRLPSAASISFGASTGCRDFHFPFRLHRNLNASRCFRSQNGRLHWRALNDEIFGSLTEHLFNRARPTLSEDDAQRSASPQEQIQKLRNHLAQKNPYFGLWVVYKRSVSDYSVAGSWDEYLLQELGTESGEEIAFAHAMVELDKLLTLFHDGNRALPSLSFERIWFLHSLRGPERMLQTRAVLGMLTAELAACTSA